MSVDALFKTFTFKGLTFPNRLVMAPMTRSKSPGGIATPEVAAYYARRAEAEIGLIITEGTGIARPASLNDPDIPRFHGAAELAAWGDVATAVHAKGGRSSGRWARSARVTPIGNRKVTTTALRGFPAPNTDSASR
jgi:2,4-dienoyl-CoA reductase-like NADH-dependent reductase (Old Yellow Enzyme family)